MNLSVYSWYNSKDDESPRGTRMGGNVGFDGELFAIPLGTRDSSSYERYITSGFVVQ